MSLTLKIRGLNPEVLEISGGKLSIWFEPDGSLFLEYDNDEEGGAMADINILPFNTFTKEGTDELVAKILRMRAQ